MSTTGLGQSREALLEQELASLLNRHCEENTSNTPDFILAQYLLACLSAWNTATQQRETWYGRDPRPSLRHAISPVETA